MPLMFLCQMISSVRIKFFKNYSEIHLEIAKFKNQCIKIGCEIYTFIFCNFFYKFKDVKKSVEHKSSWE